jgi:pyridoxamine 5'-phosphate oxidase
MIVVTDPRNSFSSARTEYSSASLSENDVSNDPFDQARRWLDDAVQAEVPEPTAMALATTTREGHPSVRTVLLKGIDSRGLIFFTNYESRKGVELAMNPAAALLFFWAELERQMRVEGTVERIDPGESDRYFSERPRESQLSAAASRQSEVLENRAVLQQAVDHLRTENEGRSIVRPSHWGGVRLVPHSFEFWQGRPNRLHDRIRYLRQHSRWHIERLFP